MCNLHYYVDLRADFKRPDSLAEPSGAELAGILADGLPAHGIAIRKVEGVDYFHQLDCVSGSSTIEVMVGAEFLGEQTDRWYILPCAKRSFFGRKDHPEPDYRGLLLAINATLHDCDRVSDIRWFPAFDTPEYLALMPPSNTPLRDPGYEQMVHPLIRFDWRFNRLSNAILSPRGCVPAIVAVLALSAINPQLAAAVFGTLFMLALGMQILVPLVTSTMIHREAKRLARGDHARE